MHRASVALMQADTAAAQIARRVGYPNLASFTRAFTESYAMSPTAFHNRGELRPFLILKPEVPLMYPVEIRQAPARRLAATPAADLRSHAGMVFAKGVQLDPPLEVITLPAGRHAILSFKDPYAGLPAAYDHIFGIWLSTSGNEPSNSPASEVYLNTPMDTAPEDLFTEICLLLA